ncbi:MAG TPA: kelch repeat-containing protein [Bdellovibrionota bacterium]|jgi:N-acetylneuraminic acid mutarotase|nr:kelch repeat-containing protein [Bdellovibrionota bacterium]
MNTKKRGSGSPGVTAGELTAAIAKTIPAQRFNNLGSVSYTITFSEAIDATSFTASDIINAGTATDLDWSITEITPNLVYQIELINVPSAVGTIIPKISTDDVLAVDGRGVVEVTAENSEKIFYKSNEWVNLALMNYGVDSTVPPIARYSHSASVIDGKIYVFGGYNAGPRQDLHVFDPSSGANGTWTEVTGFAGSAPAARNGHSSSVIDGKLYVFGGYGGGYRQDLHVYDPSAGANGTWSEVTGFAGSAPAARSSHSAGVIDGKLYIFGGYDGSGKQDLHVYDPSTGANGTWSEVTGFAGSAPSIRSSHSASVINDKLYIFGGSAAGVNKQDLHVYDPSTGANGTWTEVTGFAGSAPSIRSSHSASVINGKIYIFGGNGGGAKQDLHIYDPSTGASGTWTAVTGFAGSAPSVRMSHTASVIGGKLYILAGMDGSNNREDFHVYDSAAGANGTWLQAISSAPSARASYSASEIDGKLYIFGGNNGVPFGAVNNQELYVYDPSAGTSGTWTAVTGFAGSAPVARNGHSSSVIDGKLYIFGGSDGTYKQDLHVYDPSLGANGTWTEVTGFAGSAPVARFLHSASVIDGKLYIFGGYSGIRRQDLHVYDPSAGANGTWTEVAGFTGTAPSARSSHSASVIDDKLYIFGGFDGTVNKQDLHVYDPSAGANGTWSEVTGFAGSAPAIRNVHSASVIDGKLYIFGGYDGSYRQDLHVYDPNAGANGTWSEVTSFAGSAPSIRGGLSASVIDDKLYIFWGRNSAGPKQDLLIYFP